MALSLVVHQWDNHKGNALGELKMFMICRYFVLSLNISSEIQVAPLILAIRKKNIILD